MSLDIAEERNLGGGQERALAVEQCACPRGYKGLSCEDCDTGYTRSVQGVYLGLCEPCNCNGHSNECHPDTGVCTVSNNIRFILLIDSYLSSSYSHLNTFDLYQFVNGNLHNCRTAAITRRVTSANCAKRATRETPRWARPTIAERQEEAASVRPRPQRAHAILAAPPVPTAPTDALVHARYIRNDTRMNRI